MTAGGIRRPASQAELKTRLRLYLKRAENKTCADCNEKRPVWASILIPPPHAPCADELVVAFICFTCADAHKKCVGAGCVKNVNSDAWSEDEVIAAKVSGNLKVNEVFEAALVTDLPSIGMIKPSEGADISFREKFIREKYVEGRYFPGQKVAIQQQQQQPIPSPPLESPKKRGGVLKKFLKKEQQQQQNDPFQSPQSKRSTTNNKVKKSSDCSATADMTLTPTICSDTKSIASFAQMMMSKDNINNSSHTNLTSPSCPQVEITTLRPPTLDEKEWEKVTSPRNGTSSTVKSGDGSYSSLFDSGPHVDTISGSGSPRQSPRTPSSKQEDSPQLDKSWWNLEGEKRLNQTIEDAVPVIPPSPRKSTSFTKFLRKQMSANSNKSLSSPVRGPKSMFQLPTVTIDDDLQSNNKFGASSSSGLSCPQVQITMKPPPTLDDDEWERITRGGGSNSRCSGVQSERNGRSVFDMPNQEQQENSRVRPRRNRSSFTSVDATAVATQANARGRPKRNRSSPNILGNMQRLHQSESEFGNPLSDSGQNNEIKTPAFAFRKPQHAIDPNRSAFQKSRSGGLNFSANASNASCDLLLDDEADINDEEANNNETTDKGEQGESSSDRRGVNTRVNVFSTKRRGRSSSRPRGETTNSGGRRTRSESRLKGERTGNEKESSGRRDHRRPRSSSRRRSSSRQIVGRDEDKNLEPHNSRRERSTSRQRRRSSASNPDGMIPDFIDLTDEAEEEKSPRSEKRKSSKPDLLRSRSPSLNRKKEDDADRLKAYRNGTETPKRERRSSSRVRSGKESTLRDGGRRGRSRSSSRRRSSSRTMNDRVGTTREGDRASRRRSTSRRRESSDGLVSKRPSSSKKIAAPGLSTKERRSRSTSRARREEGADVDTRPRRSRSKSVDNDERRDIVDEMVITAASFEKYIETVSATTTDESESSSVDHHRAAEKSFRVIADASIGDMSGFLADGNSDSESFRKPYRRKKGGEEYIKERRRSGRTQLKNKNAERESRKTGIFASLDREEDAVKTNVGPLMSRMTNMAGDTPLTQLRDEFSGARPLSMKGHVSARDLGVSASKARAALTRMNESSPDLAPVDSIRF